LVLFNMIKAAIFAFLLVQLCMLQAQASHYIQFKLRRNDLITHRVGICMHDGSRVIMWDWDRFGASVQNYGFHKDGYSANVNYGRYEVAVSNWDWNKKFYTRYDNRGLVVWEGCWTTTAAQCSHFEAEAKRLCDNILDPFV
ncbi:hypothetical protein BGZ76_006230, partial [Entomortierella beljakovae]